MFTEFNARRTLLLLAAVIPSLLCVSVSAFGSSAGGQAASTRVSSHAAVSPLFNNAPRSNSLNFGVPTVKSTVKISALFMAEDNEDGENNDGESSSKVEEKGKSKKQPSGFWTALLLAPPLFAKFVIVLLVKFLTDAIVYPFLFLYRAVRRAKNKTKSVFKGDGDEDTPMAT
uniref:Transmembrane protein n=1 Tax=Ditylum brightwellii TaxID=49249 RepID=A0A6V2C517_9STRA|mmetsp:Transcript_20885/g.31055  ORF Transcript_20885/g.31055 Transcript_20885/m.31055 type:complete len:172 (+) Transcript_20885:157-672(+)